MDLESYLVLIGFIAVCVLTAASGRAFRPGRWYREALIKPSWQPPMWLFGPVWLVLYGMIAAAGWLVWAEVGFSGGLLPLGLYALQLILNGLWSYLFFGLRNPGLAFAEVLCLWLAILATLATFFPVSALAGWLMVPYLVWVTFAAVLNFTIWRLNRQPAAGAAAR